MKPKCMVALSGGVDSAVTVLSLSAEYDVMGMTLKLHPGFDPGPAERLCASLGIPFRVMERQEAFMERVITPFVETYKAGKTPNPCIYCNRRVKLPFLLEAAEDAGCDYVATGHYARVERHNGRSLLYKARYPEKDQSYMLSVLTQDQLARLILPLGDYAKEDVRKIAAEHNLESAKAADSQDICFIPDGDYAGYIRRLTGEIFPEGNFVDPAGKILGRHSGIVDYTIGQRRGLGLPLGYHAYVVAKNAERNEVTVGTNDLLFKTRVELCHINLIPFDRLDAPMRVKAKTRYSQKESDATLHQVGEDQLLLEFDQPQRAVTPGQTAVFYDGDLVVGSGEII
ncbi:MAG: tRNA 2-thiouridine(34) synthase MnmA [Ruminococcaceae bacterium]|nr:tRNA 2-thiouridine(34) synthase MnmA [Oscillospiraceae bacterium]